MEIQKRLPQEIVKKPEVLKKGGLAFGIAVSDLANDLNPDLKIPQDSTRLLDLLAGSEMGAELQIERTWGLSKKDVRKKPRFMGVHQPSKEIDIEDPLQFEKSKNKIFSNLSNAEKIGADYVALHLQTADRWGNLFEGKRPQQIEFAKDWISQLYKEHKEQGYHFKILIENLEFPKYPSTEQEMIDIKNFIDQFPDSPFGIAMDVGHLWHSGYLIRENLENPFVSGFADEWSRDEISFEDYFSRSMDSVKEDLELIHIAGGRDHETHLLPGTLKLPVDLSIVDRDYDDNELNLRKTGRIITSFVASQKKTILIVNEAHGKPYEQMIKNTRDLSMMLNKKK